MNSKTMRDMGTTLKLFIASAALIGCQSKVITAAPDPVQPEKSLQTEQKLSQDSIIAPVKKEKKSSKKYPSMNSPLIKGVYKDCDPDKYAAIVVDAITGEVLYGRNENTPRHLASLTKLMTLFLTFEEIERGRLKLDDRLKIDSTYRPNALGLTMLELDTSDVLTTRQAISAGLTLSAFDITDILAKNIAGGSARNFVKRMNTRAESFDMTETNFTNTSGAPDPLQLGTASDIAKLMGKTQVYAADYCNEFGIKTFTYHTNHTPEKYRPPFKNRFLVNGADMGKTGYIKASGFNIVQSIPMNDRRVNVVVMGAKTAKQREHHVHELLNFIEKMDAQSHRNKTIEPVDPSLINQNTSFSFMPAKRSITELKDLAPPKPIPFSLTQNFGLWATIDKDGQSVFFAPPVNRPNLTMQ